MQDCTDPKIKQKKDNQEDNSTSETQKRSVKGCYVTLLHNYAY